MAREGGSYIKQKDGTVKLVERTKSVLEAEAEKKTKAPKKGKGVGDDENQK